MCMHALILFQVISLGLTTILGVAASGVLCLPFIIIGLLFVLHSEVRSRS